MVTKKDVLENIKPLNVLILGDFIVDKYVIGDVSRISPEAPVPVVKIKDVEYRLGGAGNVAHNIAVLGGTPRVLAVVGDDAEGKILISVLQGLSCDVSYVKKSTDISTICKTRIVSKNQQFLRVDREDIEPVLDEFVADVKANLSKIFKGVDIVVISDYGKGNVTAEYAQLIIRYAKSIGVPVVVDPKGKEYRKYAGASLCTPNMSELSDATNSVLRTEEDICDSSRRIIDIGIENVLVTRSENGLSLISSEEKSDYPAEIKEVIDVTGAGDTVVAMMAMGIGSDLSLEESCVLANQAASIVISKFGTATVSLDEIRRLNNCNNLYGKIVTVTEIERIKSIREAEGKKIVFTNGCFDLLHAGHLDLLQKAGSFGDILVVGLNSDEAVRRLKGLERPIIDETNRAIMLSGLECVDYVIVFDEDTPQNLIETLDPDVLVKGADWKGKEIAGADVVKDRNGRIEYVDIKAGFSTSAIIAKIKRV